MTDTADAERRRRAFRRVMDAKDLAPAEWARRAEVSSSALYNFLNNRSSSLSARVVERLAMAAGVPVAALHGDFPPENKMRVRRVTILGEVQAGVWREAIEMPPEDRYYIEVPDAMSYGDGAFGLVVRGDSMDREYPPGTVLICVDLYDFNGALNEGDLPDHVIVERHNRDGLVEATVKELIVQSDGRAWLWPRSTNPAHQQPVEVPWPYVGQADENTGVEHVRIRAIVIGSYKPRRR